MTRTILTLIAAAALAGCGADGEPITPTANVNVGVGTSGTHAGVSVGLNKGPWNLSLGRRL